jgi:hypothetical protein
MKSFDFKTLVIGLLLGICVMLIAGAVKPDAGQKLDADYRFQLSAVKEGDGYMLFVLDHETNKIQMRRWNWASNEVDVKWMLKN